MIFFSLVGQGLSLPVLIRGLGVSASGTDADEEIRARRVATKAAIEQIDALAGEDWPRDETIERMRAFLRVPQAPLRGPRRQDRRRRI